jgi:acyl-CoA reductase-like NAD-dependent aldehyde dehydrogenase
VERALAAAIVGQRELAELPVHRRAAILRRAVEIVRSRHEELATTIVRQTGKALRDARREIDRGTYTLNATASAAEQFGQQVPVADGVPGGEGLVAVATREPLGVVAAVTPFNAPFNLVLHKLAPSVAAGNATIVKPAPQAPLSALQAVEILVEAGVPPNAISVLPGGPEVGRAIVTDERVDAVSFTGGRGAAAAIGAAAPLKRLLFELGGNSANIVHDDADISWASKALVAGGFSNTGQSCNSVQRVIAHRSVVEPLIAALTEQCASLVTGDPLDDGTDVGTLVDEASARRVETWVAEAVSGGAQLHHGGRRDGAAVTPTVLSGVTPEMRVACEEIFGPVIVVLSYESLDEAIEIANATEYGLQAAVFTRSLDVAFRAGRGIRAGAVLVNRSTNFRLDHLPFGGVKGSGTTREGGRFTLEELTHIKLMLIDPSMQGAPHPLARK